LGAADSRNLFKTLSDKMLQFGSLFYKIQNYTI
jgi:hypothetical protein